MFTLMLAALGAGVLVAPLAEGASQPATSAGDNSSPSSDLGNGLNDRSLLPPAQGTPSGTASQGNGQELTAWVSLVAVKTGIPAVALRAYAVSELTVAKELPACNLRWTTLAGIGVRESDHGRLGNSSLALDGRAVPPIYGEPLNGQGGRRAIQDSDLGRLDGDPTWDRAVGPMQFIPSTWARYAADGDSDGVTDPQDIEDAALAAGRYLCANGRDLSQSDGWWSAILSYNNVQTYAQNVFDSANDYGSRSTT